MPLLDLDGVGKLAMSERVIAEAAPFQPLLRGVAPGAAAVVYVESGDVDLPRASDASEAREAVASALETMALRNGAEAAEVLCGIATRVRREPKPGFFWLVCFLDSKCVVLVPARVGAVRVRGVS
jgi:hypothetical protein